METPSISVIVPCAGMASFLPDAVASIMRQDISVQEILVVHPVDDVDTASVCGELAGQGACIAVLEDPGKGPGPARNVGLNYATGEVISFLDADDLWPKNKLSTQMSRLVGEPHVDAVGGTTIRFDRLDRKTLRPDARSWTETFVLPNPGILVCRRNIFEKIGLFDDDFLYAEDVDLIMRMRDFEIPFAVLDEPMLYYRRHGNSMMTAGNPRMISDFRLAAMKSVRRRRQLGLPPADRQILTGDLEQWPREGS